MRQSDKKIPILKSGHCSIKSTTGINIFFVYNSSRSTHEASPQKSLMYVAIEAWRRCHRHIADIFIIYLPICRIDSYKAIISAQFTDASFKLDRPPLIIAILKRNKLGLRVSYTYISGFSTAKVFFILDVPYSGIIKRFDNRSSIISRRIVNYNQFKVSKALA